MMRELYWCKRSVVFFFLIAIFSSASAYCDEFGYDNGFYISSSDGSYRLKAGLRGQMQFYSIFDEKMQTQVLGLRVKRARVYMKGNFFSPHFKYYGQVTLEGGVCSLRDLFIQYLFAEEHLGLRVGQFKIPYNREYIISSSSLELVDRSIANKYFFWGRDVGVALTGGFFDGRVKFAAGMWTGEGKNQTPADIYPIVAIRAGFSSRNHPEKGVWKLRQGVWVEGLYWSVFGAILYGRWDGYETLQSRADKSELVKVNLEPLRGANHLYQLTADGKLQYYPFAVEVEFNYAMFLRLVQLDALSIRVQASSFLLGRKLQIAARWCYVDPDRGADNDVIQEVTGGVNFFFSSSHRLKIQNDYTYRFFPSEFQNDEFMIRIQLQFHI